MKLLNQSLKYLSFSIFIIVTLWAIVFYAILVHEIKESIDDELENYKSLIIQHAGADSSVLLKTHFDQSLYSIKQIEKSKALFIKDTYTDTVIQIHEPDDNEIESEPVRMLTTAFEVHGKYYELKVANSVLEEDDLIDSLFWSVLWLYIILIVAIILINNIMLRKLWKPFYNLLNQLKKYRLGSSQKLPEIKSRTKEFTDLQEAINTLLQHSIAVYEQQKEFIGNASHELQTPLAMVINKLELLLENETLNSANAEKVAEIFQIIERLIRLNKSLLLLSKIDNKQFFENQEVSMNKVVQKTMDDLAEIISSKGLKITLSEAGELNVHIEPTLANIIVSNLLKNAISHNREHGTIRVSITNDSLKIYNTGIDEPLIKEKIFNRFQKSGPNTNGSGLGLAIVKAIADLYKIKVSYDFQNGMHCFEIKFSAA